MAVARPPLKGRWSRRAASEGQYIWSLACGAAEPYPAIVAIQPRGQHGYREQPPGLIPHLLGSRPGMLIDSRLVQATRVICAGSVWINCYQAMDPALSFGGYKMSGYGWESGVQHLDEYLNVRSVWIQTEQPHRSRWWSDACWPPGRDGGTEWIQ